jgi:AmmeMemoRadiSam system protein B
MKIFTLLIALLVSFVAAAQHARVRPLADTIGFAHTALQMDSFVSRMERLQGAMLREKTGNLASHKEKDWKLVISPHDDYTYTGYLYSLGLSALHAKTVIVFGVAHKARQFASKNKIVFDSYDFWCGPFGDIPVSALRDDIMNTLPANTFELNDSLQRAEHSVEAVLPFLQYYRHDVEIVSILVPYMSFSRMDSISRHLSEAIALALKKRNLHWGKDVALVISNDAVHYGDEGWNGKNFGKFGTDSAGYKKALEYEQHIIGECLTGKLHDDKVKSFNTYTVKQDDFNEYLWTWCGRFSVPFGLLTAYYMQLRLSSKPLRGYLFDYNTSISNSHIRVDDLGMGITAPATMRHWVGYTVIGYCE